MAAIAYGAATIFQALSVRRLAALPSGASLHDKLGAGTLYAVGLAVDALGFLASVFALQRLPLFLVQAAVASAVAVTAALSVVFLQLTLSRREMVAIAIVVLGLVLLALSADEGPAKHIGQAAGWYMLAACVVLVALLVWGLLDSNHGRASIVLGTVAGLGFGIVGIAARILEVPDPWWGVLAHTELWALLVGGGIALVSYGFALDRGRATVVAAMTSAMETVLPAAIGLIWLGDEIRSGFVVAAVAGFALTLAGCLMLASKAEVE